MQKSYGKIVFREIRKSFGRFLAIFAIVALGVGFITGLLSTTPDMYRSVDKLFDEQHYSDIVIKGTAGLTPGDLKAIRALPSVEYAEPLQVRDLLMDINGKETLTARLYSLDFENTRVNRLNLVAGRLPENPKECVVEQYGNFLNYVAVGSSVRISASNEDYDASASDYMNTEYTVVGIVFNPYYFSKERETSYVGSGRVETILYIDARNDAFNLKNDTEDILYTDFLVRVRDADALIAFSAEYEALVDQTVDQLKLFSESRSGMRRNQIVTEGREKIADARIELADARVEARDELADGWHDAEEGIIELLDARQKMDDGYIELRDGRVTFRTEIDDAKLELEDGRVKLADALIELQDGEKKYLDGKTELDDAKKEYEDGYNEYLDGKAEFDEKVVEYEDGEREYAEGKKELDDAAVKMEEGREELSKGREDLKRGRAEYEAGLAQYEQNAQSFDIMAGQIRSALAGYGMSFTDNAALFAALEAGDPAVTGAVDGVLAGMRAALQGQLDTLSPQLDGLDGQIASLEALIESTPEEERAPLLATLSGLRASRAELAGGIATIEAQLPLIPADAGTLLAAKNQLDAAKAQLDAAKAQLETGERKFSGGEHEFMVGQDEYIRGLRELADARLILDDAKRQVEEGRQKLEDARIELEDGKAKLDDGIAELEDARRELDDGWAEYNDGLAELADGEETLIEETLKGERELRDAEIELKDGELEYRDGVVELNDGLFDYYEGMFEADTKLRDAQAEIDDAEHDLMDMDMPEWYVLDGEFSVSYASFAMNADKVQAIALIFPVFFALVAALVAMTTMTRMVEEERTQIGALKALGYSNLRIMAKYLVYSGLASVSGLAIGLFLGFRYMPGVIWNAYSVQYHLPEFVTHFDPLFAFIASALALICTLGATVYSCYHSLQEKPASLMLPKAPKAGKRIFLERVGFIWKRLKFSYKATARNLIRNKKHFFMSVIGTAGCTALVVAGFSMHESINTLSHRQYSELIRYDLSIGLDDKQEGSTKDLEAFLGDASEVENRVSSYTETGYAAMDRRLSTAIFLPEDPNRIRELISLRDPKTGKALVFDERSVLMSQQLAVELGLQKGDTFTLELSDGRTGEVSLTGIFENYIGTYVYVGESAYENVFGEPPAANTIMAKMAGELTPERQDALLSRLLLMEGVSSAAFTSHTRDIFDNLLNAISYIVIVLIAAAGGLAIIVLYNLTNININERKRELATLMVLGFHHKEIASYVFRETTILSVIGGLAGLGLGRILFVFIIETVEMPMLRFVHDISFGMYALSFAVTIVFTLIVELMLRRKLRSLQMVESMKSVD